MKKVILADQLDLSKETIANLTEEQLREIEGGAAAADFTSCGSGSCNQTHASVVEDAN
ncbi:class I lanthipeptide [Hymenobacter coccineus]|uniref:class I lanthipeptide n=1 Tax=Hymenobacter coccineus TaxID=1908235 RepID=UPI001300CD98|nr:class I lanthipeptide [Hymenobacter coccineus]